MRTLKLTAIAALFTTLALPAIAADHTVISTDNIDWGMLNPARGDASPKAADLWGDRTKDMATGMLVKFQKGFSSPPHIHNISYRGVVIEGLMHNDDKHADKMWLPSGSFWTQPAGESHITAANGEDNLIYLEIDSGPYLVQPEEHAFDNGERPINVDESNVFWLNVNDATWLDSGHAQIAYLWGAPEAANGSFVKLPAGFNGSIGNAKGLKAVVVKGTASYRWNEEKALTKLTPSSFFSSDTQGQHIIKTESEVVLYVKSNGQFSVK
ncbi:DUF4437 domain-containing protein [Ferrimonas lipolytica]|uniref:DUF4437 domain-containing protein n=1 Tax=Ferrimonas lipolytica TaxID=2724191 RepID=A0A6H1UGD6_9GAMM|nr:DUF4437 domain-containing protein [Ferrimonas lipolytica]QIZ77276.1 DUF4437 domain-containing protein [Ferrimonas lipolytica]